MKLKPHLIAFALTTLLAGLPAGAVEPAPSSSFIVDLPALKADPDRPGAYVWVSPDFRREDYGKVMLAPLTLYISPQSEEHGLDTGDIKNLAEEFREVLTRELEPEIPVVSEAGKDVLLMRGALSNVRLIKKRRGLLSFTPIGLIAYAAKSDLSKFSIKQAVLEVELIDSTTGRRLAVLVDRSPGKAEEDQAGADTKAMSWKEIEQTLQFYAARFKQRLVASRAK